MLSRSPLLWFGFGLALTAYHLPVWLAMLCLPLFVRLSQRGLHDAVALAFGLLLGWWRFHVVNAPLVVPFPPVVDDMFAAVRSWVSGGFARLMPEPEASLAGGLLIGKAGIAGHAADELILAMRRTGTMHVLAVSGFNVSIVLASVERATVNMLAPKPRGFVALGLLVVFVVLTGAEASVLRAGIMATLAVIGRRLGRPVQSKRMLLVTVLAMVLITPDMPTNLGFLLSVLATFGVLEWSTSFEHALRFVPEALGIRAALATTLAAQVLTTPLILAAFGTVSLISPVVNLFVLPVVPLAMALGAVTALVGWLPVVGQLVGWLAWLPHMAIVRCILWFSRVPAASLMLPREWWWPLAAAGVVLILVRHFRHAS